MIATSSNVFTGVKPIQASMGSQKIRQTAATNSRVVSMNSYNSRVNRAKNLKYDAVRMSAMKPTTSLQMSAGSHPSVFSSVSSRLTSAFKTGATVSKYETASKSFGLTKMSSKALPARAMNVVARSGPGMPMRRRKTDNAIANNMMQRIRMKTMDISNSFDEQEFDIQHSVDVSFDETLDFVNKDVDNKSVAGNMM